MVVGQYVQVINLTGKVPQTNLPAVLNFTELEVYAYRLSTTNLAKGMPVDMSSVYSDITIGDPKHGNDGTYSSFAHSSGADTNACWWRVNLGKMQNIDIIRMLNRRDCCYDRMAGFCFQILDSGMSPVYTSDELPNAAPVYEAYPPDKTVSVFTPSTGIASAFVSQWSPWSDCSASCGGGNQLRMRGRFPSLVGVDAIGDAIESQSCNLQDCVATTAPMPITTSTLAPVTTTQAPMTTSTLAPTTSAPIPMVLDSMTTSALAPTTTAAPIALESMTASTLAPITTAPITTAPPASTLFGQPILVNGTDMTIYIEIGGVILSIIIIAIIIRYLV